MRAARVIVLLAAVAAVAALVYIYRSPSATGEAPAAPPAAARPAEGAAINGMVVPVAGVARTELTDSWGQSREGGARAHQAIDIMAAGGTPVIAAFGGRVEKLFVSARGGTTAYIRSDDGRWIAYYAHLARYADGLREGQRLRRGDRVGYVGDTGNSGIGNYHLHFALARMAPGEKWYQGIPVDPYPLLRGHP